MTIDKKITIDYLYKSTWQLINKMYNEEAAKYGSTMTVGYVLINIHYKHGTPSTALGPKMGIEPTSLSRTLKKMENDGLIYREANPKDGRSVIIKLTDFGKEKRELSKQVVLQFNEIIGSILTKEQQQNFIKTTTIIQQAITDKKIYNDEEAHS